MLGIGPDKLIGLEAACQRALRLRISQTFAERFMQGFLAVNPSNTLMFNPSLNSRNVNSSPTRWANNLQHRHFYFSHDPPLFLRADACWDPGEGQFWVVFRSLLIISPKLTNNWRRIDLKSRRRLHAHWESLKEETKSRKREFLQGSLLFWR